MNISDLIKFHTLFLYFYSPSLELSSISPRKQLSIWADFSVKDIEKMEVSKAIEFLVDLHSIYTDLVFIVIHRQFRHKESKAYRCTFDNSPILYLLRFSSEPVSTNPN